MGKDNKYGDAWDGQSVTTNWSADKRASSAGKQGMPAVPKTESAVKQPHGGGKQGMPVTEQSE